MEKIDIKTADGTCDAQIFTPPGTGPWPGVLFFQDGVGVRPTLEHMAARLAGHGFFVLLPNLFYRTGPFAPFEPKTFTPDGTERQRLMALVASVKPEGLMRDVATFLDLIDGDARVAKIGVGCTGYCMGGQAAFRSAGTFPDRFRAAASFHGGRLATDAPDSPHLLAARIKARLYFAVAQGDYDRLPHETQLLRETLAATSVPHEIEIYPGTQHGWCMADIPIYDEATAERAWGKLVELLTP